MLKTCELIKNVNEKYIEMLKEINIPDFYKCLAVFSGLDINEISDEQVKEYLLTWANNKYRLWKMLNNNIKKDIAFEFEKSMEDIQDEYQQLTEDYPQFGPWIREFRDYNTNKMTNLNSWRCSDSNIKRFFKSQLNSLEGIKITRFCEKFLKFPEEVVTKIGRIYENNKIQAIYTISIDPVDMMLASENPYNWTSCYRLETENDESHADGCMAAVLDKNSTISYIWTSHGKFNLYDKFDFKDIRYKRMRQWVSISEHLTSLYFSNLYPSKDYPEAFCKQLRDLYETAICNHLKQPNYWKNLGKECNRKHYEYGYSEFGGRVLSLDGNTPEDIIVYDEQIKCPCGCGITLTGSYDCDDNSCRYLGEGFRHEGWQEYHYCEYCDDWCDNYEDGDCEDCYWWKQNHPLCGLDEESRCEEFAGEHCVYDGVCRCGDDCEGCLKWEEYLDNLKEEEENKENKKEKSEEEKNEESLLSSRLENNTIYSQISTIPTITLSSSTMADITSFSDYNTWRRMIMADWHSDSTTRPYCAFENENQNG